MPLTVIPAEASLERRRFIPNDFIRRRALERLYERKAAVEDLIRSLEGFMSVQFIQRPESADRLMPWRSARQVALDSEFHQAHQIVNVQLAH